MDSGVLNDNLFLGVGYIDTMDGFVMPRIEVAPPVLDIARRRRRVQVRTLLKNPMVAVNEQLKQLREQYERQLRILKEKMAEARKSGNFSEYSQFYREYLKLIREWKNAQENIEVPITQPEEPQGLSSYNMRTWRKAKTIHIPVSSGIGPTGEPELYVEGGPPIRYPPRQEAPRPEAPRPSSRPSKKVSISSGIGPTGEPELYVEGSLPVTYKKPTPKRKPAPTPSISSGVGPTGEPELYVEGGLPVTYPTRQEAPKPAPQPQTSSWADSFKSMISNTLNLLGL